MAPAALLASLRDALGSVERALVEGWSAASDAELAELVGVASRLRQAADRHVAMGAGEVARRSAPAHGLAGFAQRSGHRTVEEYLRHESGMTARDAAVSVRVGTLDGALGDAVRGGSVSVPAAEAIRSGLGEPSAAVPIDLLDQAAQRLVVERLDPDRLQRRAREVRDELDEAGIVDRERARRAQRSLRLTTQADGMTRIVWLLDPESAAVVTGVYDRATSPRRGGPRFVDPTRRDAARRVADDIRTTEQLASDAFTELLRQAATVDERDLCGGEGPSVQVLIAERSRHGVLATGESVSIATVERVACAAGVLPVIVDRVGQVLDFGRSQRLFTRAQRRALAVRDGGCMWPGCDRPPSWTEAHHIRRWIDGGRTDLADGILLCRHHHLRLHDEGGTITRRAGRYWLEPPPGSGRAGALLETKSRAVRELLAG